MKSLCLIALLLAGSTAAAQEATATSPDAAASTSTAFYDGNHFGLQIDAGVPSGATVALVARPWSFLRVNAGAGYNLLAPGVKAGVTLVPFHWGVVPTLGLEAGHFFGGNVNNLVSVSDPTMKVLLSDVGYDYLLADIGLEFGVQNRFVFYVRAGLSQIYASVPDFQAALNASNPSMRIAAADPSVSGRIATARLGFVLYLF